MTLVVELTVPDGWPEHVTWAAMAARHHGVGLGRLSLDYLIGVAIWTGAGIDETSAAA
jgi:putative oxidoreductase